MATLEEVLTSKIPPHSLEAERAVLGSLLLEPDAPAAVLPRLTADDFYKEGHRTLYRAMGTLAAGGRAVDPVTLIDVLRGQGQLDAVGGGAIIAQLIEEAATLSHLDAYVAMLRDKASLRGMIQLGSTLVTRAYANHRPPLDLLADAARELDGLTHQVAPPSDAFAALTIGELLRTPVPEVPFHVQGWIPARALTFIVGDSEAYKSWFADLLALCVAAGQPFLGTFPVVQAPTLVISEENGLAEDKRRVGLLCQGLELDADATPCHVASETSFSFDDPARYAALRAYIAEHGIRLVVVDSFVRVHRRKENDAGEMNALYLDRMKPLIQDGVALVFLHHRRKVQAQAQGGAQAGDSDEIRGSGDIRAATHSVLFLRTVSDTQVLVKHNKTRGFRRQEPFVFAVQDTDTGGTVIRWEGKPQDALDKSGAAKEAILLYAAEKGSFSRVDLEAHFKQAGLFSRKIIRPVLDGLSKNHIPLRMEQRGRRAVWYHYIPQGAASPEAPDIDPELPF